MLKTVFLGTPAVAVPFLEKLAGLTALKAVVTSPDAPKGRGYALTPSAVKEAALRRGITVFSPPSLRDPEGQSALIDVLDVDLALVVAYGKLVPRRLFTRPRLGMVNVHFSLLPRLRGAAPVQWALIRGEKSTGVSLFQIDEGMDSGPVFLSASEAILLEDTAPLLRARLERKGLLLLEDLLRQAESGTLAAQPQNHAEATLAPLLKKEDGRVSWAEQSAEEVFGLVRGTWEWPEAFIEKGGAVLKIKTVAVADESVPQANPGRIIDFHKDRGILVACAKGALWVREVKPPGKSPMAARDYWNGARLSVGGLF